LRQEVLGVPPSDQPPFERLLIANRGEIAVRVSRACAELGIRSIAVFSEADRDALHTRMADEAHLLGPGPAAESYLEISRIVSLAQATSAEAIHPGYGFLAESAAFAEACSAAGLVFIGPTPAAMRLLGDKAAARKLAAANGVPIVPGYDGAAQDDDTLAAEADRIGYPLLVKAAAGGGGRGMRTVLAPDDLVEALASARREASAAFGDETLILERLVTNARHVEIQILGDIHGTLLHLGERDCSVQRRHQKVVEESPAPSVTPALRSALGDAAMTVARAAGYSSAGTCEFLLDDQGRFWFIEMNARLQVEHPVTELVTGLDLVRAQIEIAAGQPLRWRQDDVLLRGHAIECRLYAEDPARDDLPSPGRLTRFRPSSGPGLRHDVGYGDGDIVPPFYDTMLGKLIAYGDDRATAIGRARAGLDQYVIAGVPTNRDLLTWILDHSGFRDGTATTDFLAARPVRSIGVEVPPAALAAAVAWHLDTEVNPTSDDPRTARTDWRIAGQGVATFWFGRDDSGPVSAVADRDGHHSWRVTLSDTLFRAVVAAPTETVVVRPGDAGDGIDVATTRCRIAKARGGLVVLIGNHRYEVRRAEPPGADLPSGQRAEASDAVLVAPMPGRVVRIAVTVGDAVREHQPLVVVEAMKIENVIGAPRSGTVLAIHCAVGDAVAGGQMLVELSPQ
jgi:3-methylcrotonyl-CoA carboxylase alpha subunit